MNEHPILFSASMVRALLDGTKTQTRRIVKQQPCNEGRVRHLAGRFYSTQVGNLDGNTSGEWMDMLCPYGVPGDRLWVRETFAECEQRNKIWYGATDDKPKQFATGFLGHGVNAPLLNWTPAIFMPKKACRLRLEVTGIRLERLQAISVEDAIAEGVPTSGFASPIREYEMLWESINGNWKDNPWVWVITFRRLTP